MSYKLSKKVSLFHQHEKDLNARQGWEAMSQVRTPRRGQQRLGDTWAGLSARTDSHGGPGMPAALQGRRCWAHRAACTLG